MKLFSFFLALTLVFSLTLGTASAQENCEVYLDNVTNVHNDTDLVAEGTHIFTFGMRVNCSELGTYNSTNGIKVYSPDGATWGYTQGAFLPEWESMGWTMTYRNHFNWDGSAFVPVSPNIGPAGGGPDPSAVSFAGISFSSAAGLPTDFDGLTYTIEIQTSEADIGKHVCIDSTFTPPGGSWKWVSVGVGQPDIFADWNGPFCFRIGIPEENLPPVLDEIGNKPIDEGQLLEFRVHATDPEGATPSLDAVGLPDGAIFVDSGNGAGSFSWTPAYDQADAYSVTFTASDGELTDSETITITVNNVNRNPVLAEIGDKSIDENQLLEFRVSATDPDGTTPSLDAVGLIEGAVFVDSGNGAGSFSWTPTYYQADIYSVTFNASDGDLTDSETITITVNDVNRPPVLDAIGPQNVNEGELLEIQVTASDPDGTIPVLSSESLPDGATFDDASGLFSWTPTDQQSGGYSVLFIASDGFLADSEWVAIEVIDMDGFIVTPNVFNYTLIVDGPNPPDTTFNVAISDGSMVGFILSEEASWITVNPMNGVTPLDITLSINITGLTVNTYSDSIQVTPNLGVGGGLKTLSPEELEPVWVYVNLNIIEPAKILVVEPQSFYFDVSEGDLLGFDSLFNVTELGGTTIGYKATTEAAWFTLADDTGETPGAVTVSITPPYEVGSYLDSIKVASADADNQQEWVMVHLTVNPCPVFEQEMLVYDTAGVIGQELSFTHTESITSSGPDEIAWTTSLMDPPFSLTPPEGTTPSEVAITYTNLFGDAGFYSDTTYINATIDNPGVLECPSQIVVVVNVTVPSADTVIAVTAPAVPGMQVVVPVLFSNSCPLSELYVGMMWDSDEIFLDSISFVGSAFEYLDNKYINIDPVLKQFAFSANVDGQELIPIGSRQLAANLHFVLSCEIADGHYPVMVTDPDTSIFFIRDCGEGPELEIPADVKAYINVGSAADFICGYVVEKVGDNYVEVEGATVELWADYPSDGPNMSTMSSSIGSFAFDSITVAPLYDLYAYKDGYYPGTAEDLNFGEKGVLIILERIPDLIPTSQHVSYYCPDSSNMYFGALVPAGAVVEAFTPSGLLVGRQVVETPGKFRFLEVYRASTEFGDDGAVTGDVISFTINGFPAEATGNTIYPAEYAEVEVCLEVRGVEEQSCELFEGWNLISWRVNTDTDDILTVLDPIMDYVDVILGFEQGGLTFDPDLQQFSTLWEVDHLSGYWVRIEGVSQVTLTVTGLPVPTVTPIPLAAGWNLVSYLPEAGMGPVDALVTVNSNLIVAYGIVDNEIKIYRPEGGTLNSLESMNPCSGYWLKMMTGDVLVYPEIPGAPVASPRGVEPLASLGTEYGVVTTTEWVNLYSENLTLDGRTIEAGAVITAHSFDNDAPLGSFVVSKDGLFGFMPVYADADVNGMRSGDEFYLAIDGVPTEDTFAWTNSGDRIEVAQLSSGSSAGIVPEDYSLAQNYPNPFNPATTIKFNMKTAGQARIEVFNILGALIATPLDGMASAGPGEVVWDGRNSNGESVASGVYLYRFTTDDFSDTKKMMLLK